MGNNFKTTLILLVVAVGLSLWARYAELQPEWQKPVGGVFTRLSRDRFEALELIPGPGAEQLGEDVIQHPVGLRHRKDEGEAFATWKIVEPIEFPAFTPRVEGILNAILEMQRINTLPPGEEAPFFDGEGLAMTIRFRTRDPSAEEHVVKIGRAHPDPTLKLVCAQVDDEPAFFVRERIRETLGAGFKTIRSRALFPIPAQDAVSLRVQRFGEEGGEPELLALEREPGSVDWRLTSPVTGVADRRFLREVLDELNSWKIEEFVADEKLAPAEDLPDFESPRLEVRLENRYGRVHEYRVARETGAAEMVHVRTMDGAHVFLAGANVVEMIERPATDFRSRTVLQIGASKVVKVEGTRRLEDGERSFLLEPVPGAKTEKVQARPGLQEAGESLEQPWRVEDRNLERVFPTDRVLLVQFLKRLESLAVVEYLESGDALLEGLAGRQPVLELTVTLDTGARIELDFFSPPPGEERPEAHFIVTRSDGEEVALARTALPIILESGGIHFRTRELSGLEIQDIQSFDIMNSQGRSWTLTQIQGVWRLKETALQRLKDGKSLDEQVVFRALSGLSRNGFRVEEYLPDQSDREALRLLELLPGRSRIQVDFITGFNDHQWGFRRLRVGARRERSPLQESYAILDTVEMPFLISREIVAGLVDLVNHLGEISEG